MAYDTAMFDRVPWFFLGGFPDPVGWPGVGSGRKTDLIPGWVVSTIFIVFTAAC